MAEEERRGQDSGSGKRDSGGDRTWVVAEEERKGQDSGSGRRGEEGTGLG